MKKSKIVLFFFSILFFKCNMSDDVKELSGGYQFVHEGKNVNSIVGDHNINVNVIGYAFNNDFIIAKQLPNKELYSVVKKAELYNRYEKYIADQKNGVINLKDSNIHRIFVDYGASPENTKLNLKISRRIADSLIEVDTNNKKMFSGECAYWIIKHGDHSINGPFTEKEYNNKRKELNIPVDLEIRNLK